ncbi:uncharacterized protein LOC127695355 isoform X2 [Apodemus sylvaticus]|uniref:uncharacterized protein LOC127695355 isoform X2 n=1 Tax=Apodemus sylvaticus TaxID=10129 RepID=UPI002241AF17|nr:uncharacterized protein LOC127695355 isoform X2 [Apodemus sylvaticus]
MSHFNNWKSTQMSQSLTPHDSIRVSHERKRENKKHEELPEGHHSPHGQMLQDKEGVRSPESRAEEAGEGRAAEEGPLLSKTELQKDIQGSSDSKASGQDRELSPPTTKNFRIYDVSPLSSPYPLQTEKMSPHRRARMARLPQQGPFRHLMDMKAEKRLAGWKERRSRFGDINVHKCYQFGQVFSPFQALATTEMRRLVLPRDLPMSSHMRRINTSSLGDMNLQDLPLSPKELALGKDDSHREKEKPVNHIKKPLFPPIVKATKYNDMK